MDVRMLGTGRPFVLEVHNMRAAMPPAAYFADVQRRLAEALITSLTFMMMLSVQLW